MSIKRTVNMLEAWKAAFTPIGTWSGVVTVKVETAVFAALAGE
jgi:hypothetical protein